MRRFVLLLFLALAAAVRPADAASQQWFRLHLDRSLTDAATVARPDDAFDRNTGGTYREFRAAYTETMVPYLFGDNGGFSFLFVPSGPHYIFSKNREYRAGDEVPLTIGRRTVDSTHVQRRLGGSVDVFPFRRFGLRLGYHNRGSDRVEIAEDRQFYRLKTAQKLQDYGDGEALWRLDWERLLRRDSVNANMSSDSYGFQVAWAAVDREHFGLTVLAGYERWRLRSDLERTDGTATYFFPFPESYYELMGHEPDPRTAKPVPPYSESSQTSKASISIARWPVTTEVEAGTRRARAYLRGTCYLDRRTSLAVSVPSLWGDVEYRQQLTRCNLGGGLSFRF